MRYTTSPAPRRPSSTRTSQSHTHSAACTGLIAVVVLLDPVTHRSSLLAVLLVPVSSGIRTIKTNVLGTLNMLGMAKRLKARFLISSTSEVYGDPDVHPQVEEYWGNVNPIGIRSCYDEGKRLAESLCFEYYRQHGVDIRVARIFNVSSTPASAAVHSCHAMHVSDSSIRPAAVTHMQCLFCVVCANRHTVLVCWRTTVVWCPTSSSRP